MASEASQRQFRGSRNAFNKFAKELSIGIVDASKDSQCFEAEIKQFEELYNIVVADGEAYRSTLDEETDDEEAKQERKRYDVDIQVQAVEYNKVKVEINSRSNRIADAARSSGSNEGNGVLSRDFFSPVVWK